jgi:hypothetical protein
MQAEPVDAKYFSGLMTQRIMPYGFHRLKYSNFSHELSIPKKGRIVTLRNDLDSV